MEVLAVSVWVSDPLFGASGLWSENSGSVP